MYSVNKGKLIIFSAPSGSGKTTIVHRLMQIFDCLEFSISATSRAPRGQEVDGKDYYFLTNEEFDSRVAADCFVEWEEVYHGTKYGTLKSEMERIWAKNHTILFDVDVKGGVNLKSIFGENALAVFVMPPSVEELRRRLVGRGTDSAEMIERRVAKAEEEIAYADKFDRVVVNDSLEDAVEECRRMVTDFLAV
ncbi:MAG: guanylate kinase [Tidjanibacter sp.]|nr:guanylate kinase [Tidjanibacter sp.]